MNIKEWLGNDNQLGYDIWTKKYQYQNESFEEWLERISNGDEELKQLIREKKFLFGGRILANRGLQNKGKKITYSNCYVISPPEDNIESIYKTAGKLARTYSYGGGCGIDISKLSPRGAKVNNAAESTSGAVSFMDTYSQVTGQIGQAGRRGALMISLDCHHPDLEEFLDIKTDLEKVTKANISVRITDDFMQAVCNNEPFILSFTREETGEIIEKEVNAREIFYKLAENNWGYAEPGCLFWDNISEYNLLANIDEFEYAGTNPCAEEPLPAGGSCLLGSLNLNAFVKNHEFQYNEFEKAVKISIKALDDVREEGLKLHPLKEQRKSVDEWKQLGLGIFGLADCLINLKLKYGSDDAIDFCDAVGWLLATSALQKSSELSKERGNFKYYDKEKIISSPFYQTHLRDANIDLDGLHNSQLLTIAPTGTISTMLGVSGGIEPIFANSYERKTQSLHGEDVIYKVYTPIVKEYMDKYGVTEEELPEWFITAPEIHYTDRINMQSVWQKHIDASISSTVNVPNDFTVDDTFNLYMYAWQKGLKGVTIYRDGCNREGILTTNKKEEPKEEPIIPTGLERGTIKQAHDNVIGLKRKLMTGCGSLHCTAFFDADTSDLVEVYLSKGSTGGCNNFMIGLSRLISLAARGGVSIVDIVDQLMSTGACPSYRARQAVKHDTSKGSCCPVAIGYALKEMWEDFQGKELKEKEPVMTSVNQSAANYVEPTCPECGGKLIFEGGCNICRNCGWSKCN